MGDVSSGMNTIVQSQQKKQPQYPKRRNKPQKARFSRDIG